MATLAEPAITAPPQASRETGGWGLLLIPILLCLGMLAFGLLDSGLASEAPPSTSRTCVGSSQPGPAPGC